MFPVKFVLAKELLVNSAVRHRQQVKDGKKIQASQSFSLRKVTPR